MSRVWPTVVYKEEVMREGMQIESADIAVDDKIRLLDALGDTGLKNIVVGSFVRPDYTPQMACMDELLSRFTPRPGVTYTALLLNAKAVDRAQQYSPPLTIEAGPPRLAAHMCDVFARRNINRSRDQVKAGWPQTVARAQERDASAASIGAHAAWGSNFTGEVTVQEVMDTLQEAHDLWDNAGIPVVAAYLGDPMSWTTPYRTEELLSAIKDRWPHIHHFVLHLHDARGMALVSAYAALRTLDPDDSVQLEGTVGGVGGCPYCGNGRATGMMATEDLMHMLDSIGVAHGVDIDKVIDCAWLLEDLLGRHARGSVSRAGRRPLIRSEWYDPNMPFVETFDEASHFKRGSRAYAGGRAPWKQPIIGPSGQL